MAPSLQTGHKLGPYTIVAKLGAGGMGEVYKARDTRLDRTIAIKVCKEQFSERFERETRAIAALNHPHIATLHDVGPNYLVMEYVEGEQLKGPLPVDHALRYAMQIADALESRAPERNYAPGFEAREHPGDQGRSETAGLRAGEVLAEPAAGGGA